MKMMLSLRGFQQLGVHGVAGHQLGFWLSDGLAGLGWVAGFLLVGWLAGHYWNWTQVTPAIYEIILFLHKSPQSCWRRARLWCILQLFCFCEESQSGSDYGGAELS